jgi:hypothetical protein
VDLFAKAGLSDVGVTLLEEVHRTALHPAGEQPPYAIMGLVQ